MRDLQRFISLAGVLLAEGTGCSSTPQEDAAAEAAGPSQGGSAGGSNAQNAGLLSACPEFPAVNDAGQELVFCDDFSGDALDRSVWSAEEGMLRNREEQCYLDRAENIVVQDGELRIVAIPETVDDPLCRRRWSEDDEEPTAANYTSASLMTRDTMFFTYGRIEARLRVPSATGVWPAFWMRPQEKVYGGWPTSGEIDVMEYVSQTPNQLYGTVHFDFFGHEEDGGVYELDRPVSDDYHVVALEWTPSSIDWFVDGGHYHSFDSSRDIQQRRPFDEDFYLVLNVAVGGTWPEDPVPQDYPAELRVDWVRVYRDPDGL